MAEADKLKYPGDESPQAWLRRIGLALAVSLAITTALALALVTLLRLFPSFKDTYAQTIGKWPSLPEATRQIPWSRGSFVIIALLMTPLFVGSRLSRATDFYLFSPVDRRTLQPVKRQTGMFLWYLPKSGPLFDAWTELATWALSGTGDGRWPLSWLWSGPQLERPFGWTLLTGGNGVGKTQLARELARQFGKRSRFGDDELTPARKARRPHWRTRFSAWWARVAWWTASSDTPWDSGMILKHGDGTEEALRRLEDWLPRAPTLLILDDPPADISRRVINLLAARSRRMWYPVRLLIVDQIVPSDLPITKNVDREGWHHTGAPEAPFTPVVLDEAARFDPSHFRAALAKGYWMDGADGLPTLEKGLPARALRDDEEAQQLVDAVEGNPLLLTLSTYWLRKPGRTLVHLLDDSVSLLNAEEREVLGPSGAGWRQLIAHRLTTERLEDVYQQLKLADGSGSSSLRRAIVCATVADGISRKDAAERFGLHIETSTLHRLFPSAGEYGDRIPPMRPWLLAERLAHKIELDLFPGDPEPIDELIMVAWELNSAGTMKALSRPGRLPGRIARHVGSLPLPKEASAQCALFCAFARHATSGLPEALRTALEVAERMSPEAVPRGAKGLELLTDSPNVDRHVLMALHLTLAKRQLQDVSVDSIRVDEILENLEQPARGLHPDQYANRECLGLLQSAFEAVAALLVTAVRAQLGPNPPRELLERLAARQLFDVVPLWLGILGSEMASVADRDPAVDPLYRLVAEFWRSLALEDVETTARLRQLAASTELEPVTRALFVARSWRIAIVSHAARADFAGIEAILRRIDDLAQPFPANADVQLERSLAIELTTKGYASYPAMRSELDGLAARADAVAEPFPDHPRIQLARASVWLMVAYARNQWRPWWDRTLDAANVVEAITSRFPDHSRHQLKRIHALRYAAFALLELVQLDALEAMIASLEALAGRHQQDYQMHRERAEAWLYLAGGLANNARGVARAAAAARRVEAAARPFGNALEIQLSRAKGCLAIVTSSTGRDTVEAEAAARVIDSIAHRFPDSRDLLLLRADAWSRLGAVRRDGPDGIRGTIAAANVVDKVAMQVDGGVTRERARAWRHVVEAHLQTVDGRAVIENFAQIVDDIAQPHANDQELQEVRADAWRLVSHALVQRGDVKGVEQAAQKVATIAAQFPESSCLQDSHAMAWREMAAAYASAERYADSLLAIESLAAIVAPYAQRAEMQVHHAGAWADFAEALRNTPGKEHDAEIAALEVDKIALAFPDDFGLQLQRAVAWTFAARSLRKLDRPDEAARAAMRALEIAGRFRARRNTQLTFVLDAAPRILAGLGVAVPTPSSLSS